MTTVQRRAIITALLIAISLAAIGALFWWLWGVLAGYIQPKTPTDKKDLVNVFVVIAAGVVGTLTAIAAVGNLIISRRNLQNAQATLQQQRDLDEQRAQDDALQDYFKQMGDLLTVHKLMETENADDPIRLLARAQTLTLLERLGSETNRARKKKRELTLFLHDAGLLNKDNTIVDLANANLRDAALGSTNLSDANLTDANLSGAYLGFADLSGANLSGADLRDANLNDANLNDANLRYTKGSKYTKVTKEQLSRCRSLEGATITDGSGHE